MVSTETCFLKQFEAIIMTEISMNCTLTMKLRKCGPRGKECVNPGQWAVFYYVYIGLRKSIRYFANNEKEDYLPFMKASG